MSKALQRSVFALCALALGLAVFSARSHASLAQAQRDQISIGVVVNVTPAAARVPAPAAPAQIAAHMRLREAKGSAQNVDALPPGELVAQTVQKAVKVQALVSPNPNATLLYGNSPGVSLSATAGTTVTQSCAYTVTVHTTITTWTLREGVSGDFTSGFPGGDLANNSYGQSATPQPTSTPFVVYPTSWTVLAASGGIQTYCVDLTVTVPVTVAGGAYSTNAVYTLYY